MIELFASNRGERGLKCEITKCDNGSIDFLRMRIVSYKYFGFPSDRESNYTLLQAKHYAEVLLKEGAEVRAWNDEIAEMISLSKPILVN